MPSIQRYVPKRLLKHAAGNDSTKDAHYSTLRPRQVLHCKHSAQSQSRNLSIAYINPQVAQGFDLINSTWQLA